MGGKLGFIAPAKRVLAAFFVASGMASSVYYVLKVKGKAKIPDYLQVRDADFTLIGYFRPGRKNSARRKSNPNQVVFEALAEKASDLDYGIVTKIELDERELSETAQS